MEYTNNAIFTAIRTSVRSVVSTAYCTQTYTATPTKFPTVFAREIGRLTPNGTPTLSNAQDIYETTWEVQVITNVNNGSKEQAYTLMDAVKSALRPLYFAEVSENPLENNGNQPYFVLVARYRRIIGSGEQMPN